jgi:hypothetical protein
MWILFIVPCPTPDGRTAEDLYQTRVERIDEEMSADAADLGCTFHRAWHSADGSTFYAIANWRSREAASTFFERWSIEEEPGEIAVELLGDVGLAPLG